MVASTITSKSKSVNTKPGREPAAEGCAYCNGPTFYSGGWLTTEPPLCEIHYDLVLLVEHMRDQGQALTLENVSHRLEWAVGNGGQWALTPAHLPSLLPAYLESRGEGQTGGGVGGEAEPQKKQTSVAGKPAKAINRSHRSNP